MMHPRLTMEVVLRLPLKICRICEMQFIPSIGAGRVQDTTIGSRWIGSTGRKVLGADARARLS